VLPEGTTNSVWIRYDHLKSIVYVLEIHFVGTGFVRWPSRDRMSILSRSCRFCSERSKSRSCVDFAKIVCQFHQMFNRVRLRFRKSSPRWRIVGREEIKRR